VREYFLLFSLGANRGEGMRKLLCFSVIGAMLRIMGGFFPMVDPFHCK